MKVNEIEELLVRYYDGETNEAEEKELKEFFAQADVPAHLLAENSSCSSPHNLNRRHPKDWKVN